jgi:hypothetical protein
MRERLLGAAKRLRAEVQLRARARVLADCDQAPLRGQQSKSLRLCRRILTLYKVREIIADALGGDAKLFDRQWCSRNELARFDRTANHQEVIGQFSRHARSKVAPPPSPMTESDARTFLLKLITLWTKELL